MNTAPLDAVADETLREASDLSARLRDGDAEPQAVYVQAAAVDRRVLGIRELDEPSTTNVVRLRIPSRSKKLPRIRLNDPGFWVGMSVPLVITVVLLVAMAIPSDATPQTVLAAGASAVGTLVAVVTALGLGQRLGVNTSDVVKVLDKMSALIDAYKANADAAGNGKPTAEPSVKITITGGTTAKVDPESVTAGTKTKLEVTSDTPGTLDIGDQVKALALTANTQASAEVTFAAAGSQDIEFTATDKQKAKVATLTITAATAANGN